MKIDKKSQKAIFVVACVVYCRAFTLNGDIHLDKMIVQVREEKLN